MLTSTVYVSGPLKELPSAFWHVTATLVFASLPGTTSATCTHNRHKSGKSECTVHQRAHLQTHTCLHDLAGCCGCCGCSVCHECTHVVAHNSTFTTNSHHARAQLSSEAIFQLNNAARAVCAVPHRGCCSGAAAVLQHDICAVPGVTLQFVVLLLLGMLATSLVEPVSMLRSRSCRQQQAVQGARQV